jgi:ABC-type amino acid transport substrate-binding protein
MVIAVLSPTVFYKKITSDSYFTPQEYKGIIRLWHIDTFEGGKGSRAEFLSKRALEYEKKNSGQLILISIYSLESASEALKKGECPDLISYGAGISETASLAYPLNSLNFKGGNISGENFAYPWCYGKYAIFSLKGEIDLNNLNGKTVINSNGGISAAALSELKINYETKTPINAYVDFINGQYDYLIGTQRDICRFQSRNLNVYIKPLGNYSDLYQYISILTKDTIKSAIAKKFINYLLSENSQKKLTALSMMSVNYNIYNSENPYMQMLESSKITSTISVFMPPSIRQQFFDNSKAVLDGDNETLKKIQNILIYI